MSPTRRISFAFADQGGALQGLCTIPEGIWEAVLAIFPMVWGSRRVPILTEYERSLTEP